MKKYIVFLILTGLFGFGLMGQNEKVGKELMKVIKTRASVRQFADKPIEVEKVSHMLLDAAMAAPTAMNKQPWEFIVISDPEIMKRMGKEFKNASALSTAQLAIIVCGNMKEAIEGESREFWVQDCSAATENLLLMAHSMGLGAVWCGIYPSKERTELLQKFLNLPENIIPMNIIPIGVPADVVAPKEKFKKEKIHWNKFGNHQVRETGKKKAPLQKAKPIGFEVKK